MFIIQIDKKCTYKTYVSFVYGGTNYTEPDKSRHGLSQLIKELS